jgi:osmoprotectant transport system permease protein
MQTHAVGWGTVRRYIGPVLGLALLLWLCIPEATRVPFEFVFPDAPEVIYDRASLLSLIGEHLVLVTVSTFGATILGLLIGIGVTRRAGRAFLPLAQDASSLAQTFPPVAVLALAVPILGFGFTPTVAALFIYSILPVVKNTIAGLEAVPGNLLEASTGMGMRPVERLLRTELPLAARVILAGVRTSVVLNVGTATIGATIGAGGLGRIIIAGLVRDNPAWILTGALAAAVLALLADWLFARLDARFYAAGEVI